MITSIRKHETIQTNKTFQNAFLFCILLLQNISVFFLDIVKSFTILQFVCLLLYTLFYIMFHKHLKVTKYLSCWIMYVIVTIFNIFAGGDIYFVITFAICNISLLFQINVSLTASYEYKIIKIFSCIHLIGSLLVYFFPSFVEPSLQILLKENYNANYYWRINAGVNAGITTQPGLNAIFLTLLFLLCFVELFMTHKKPVENYLLMVLSFIMLLTTSKRSMLLLSILMIIILFFLLKNKRSQEIKKKNRSTIGILFFLSFCALIIVALSSNVVSSLLDKISHLNAEGDISNGRFTLWRYAFDQFLKNPIFGVGLKSIYNEIGYDVHNTYIQVLAETGLIGFTIMLVALVWIVKHSYKNMLDVIKHQNSSQIVVVCFGFALMLLLLLYGFFGNIFIDYMPIALFASSILMANSQGDVAND